MKGGKIASELKENKYWRFTKNKLIVEPDPGGERTGFVQP